MITRLLGAVQFLTLVPIRLKRSVPLSEAAPFFPLVGATLGALAGSLLLLLQPFWGGSLSSAVALVTLVSLTGGLHEDGLADIADACRAGRSRETILRILKDSRIGSYGAVMLVGSFLLRWQALSRCRLNPILGLLAAVALSRTALVVLAGVSPSIGEGLGALFISNLSPRLVLGSVVIGVTLAGIAAHITGLVMVGLAALTVASARFYFVRRLGGVNGDCLGATCQVVETVNLLILAWQPST